MALSAQQVTDVGVMVGETPDAVSSALYSVTRSYSEELAAEIENALADDADTYKDLSEKRHLRVSGGKDGVDLNYDRRLEKLRIDNRIRLGLSPVSASDYASDPNAITLGVLQGVRW